MPVIAGIYEECHVTKCVARALLTQPEPDAAADLAVVASVPAVAHRACRAGTQAGSFTTCPLSLPALYSPRLRSSRPRPVAAALPLDASAGRVPSWAPCCAHAALFKCAQIFRCCSEKAAPSRRSSRLGRGRRRPQPPVAPAASGHRSSHGQQRGSRPDVGGTTLRPHRLPTGRLAVVLLSQAAAACSCLPAPPAPACLPATAAACLPALPALNSFHPHHRSPNPQLDFLPFKCSRCSQVYCLDHRACPCAGGDSKQVSTAWLALWRDAARPAVTGLWQGRPPMCSCWHVRTSQAWLDLAIVVASLRAT